MKIPAMGGGGGTPSPDWANKVLITNSTSAVSDKKYDVPSNGFITGTGNTPQGGPNAILTIQIKKNGSTVANFSLQQAPYMNLATWFPVAEGDEAHIWCTFTGSNSGVYFVPWK